MAKKRLSNEIGGHFLSDTISMHMEYDVLLSQKMGFLIAIASLLLTIALTGFLTKGFAEISVLIKTGIIIAAVGASFCIIICLSAERPEAIRKIKGIMPLSATIATDSPNFKANSELKKILNDNERIVKLYSDEMLYLKDLVHEKGRKFTIAIFTLVACMLIAAALGAVQLYITIFRGI